MKHVFGNFVAMPPKFARLFLSLTPSPPPLPPHAQKGAWAPGAGAADGRVGVAEPRRSLRARARVRRRTGGVPFEYA